MKCTTDDDLAALCQGGLGKEARERTTAHLDVCAICRQLVGMLAMTGNWLVAEGHDAPVPLKQNSQLKEEGGQVGRYPILRRIGQGGMGTVYLGYDAELDRSVAIKLLKTKAGNDDGERNARLRKEGVALAKLSHPNVVGVYDVGSWHGGSYVVMEHVAGCDLKSWLAHEPRIQIEIVSLFLKVAQGLAAAHEAGLVHRDVKPSNILLGENGRVCITDFGLARVVDEEQTLAGEGALDAESVDVTGTGTVLGTPTYMAPEQHRAQAADARSDQFSFCVTLYKALYGTSPFQGDTGAALAEAKILGKLAEAPSGAKVPYWLCKLLRRGLRPEPSQRYPSMDALHAALLQGTRQNSRRWAFGASALVALSGVAGFVLFGAGNSSPPPCKTAGEEMAEIWNDAARKSISRAFLDVERPHAQDATHRVIRALDEYTTQWVTARTDACEATHVRGTQSESLLDLRMICLSQRYTEFYELVQVFGAKPIKPEILDNASRAVAHLPSLDGCADARALTATVPLPENPETRKRIAAIREHLAHASARYKAADFSEGLSLARKVDKNAADVGFSPLRSESLFLLAQIQDARGEADDAQSHYRSTIDQATEAQNDLLVAEAWGRLSVLIAETTESPDDARDLLLHAELALKRAGGNETLAARLLEYKARLLLDEGKFQQASAAFELVLVEQEKLFGSNHAELGLVLNNLGAAAEAMGEYDQAVAFYQRALVSDRAFLGPDHPDATRALGNLGNALLHQGKHAEAKDHQERALQILENALGREHPEVARTLNNYGAALLSLRLYEEALPILQRALAIRRKVLGSEHSQVATTLGNIGYLYNEQGHHSKALEYIRESLKIRESVLGPGHPKIAYSLNSLGTTLKAAGETNAAADAYERALAIRKKALGKQHPKVGEVLYNIGEIHVLSKRYKVALPYFAEALSVFESALGKNHPYQAAALDAVGETNLLLGSAERGIPYLEKAISLRIRLGHSSHLAGTRFTLARALCDTGDVSRARDLARQAREYYRTAGSEAQLAKTDLWLRNHRKR